MSYALSNAWPHEAERLRLVEDVYDPNSRRRLARLGVGHGWRCLDVGAGGGSVARWLCERVGSAGSVVATDIDVRFLERIRQDNLEVRRHDVAREPLPEGEFDLVHCRFLLHHLADLEAALTSMVAAVRPGGWLLVEDMDYFTVSASSAPAYADLVLALTRTAEAASGGDCFAARDLPRRLTAYGLGDLGAEGSADPFNGGSPTAELVRLTAEQLRSAVGASGRIEAERFDEAIRLLEDPGFWGFWGASIAAWGRRVG